MIFFPEGDVYKRQMSTLYGSDAMGGVVNIITRKNADKWLSSGFRSGLPSRFVDVYKRQVYTCEIVGYAMGERMTKELTGKALFMALRSQRPPAGLIHHLSLIHI